MHGRIMSYYADKSTREDQAMLDIHPVPAFEDNYIWLIPASGQRVVVVDPGDADAVLSYCKKQDLSLSAILITHHHWDHCNGISTLLKNKPVPVFGPANEEIAEITHPLKEGDHIKPPGLDFEFEILDVPGHTAGHVAYLGNNCLFSGDTLFAAGCGRLFEGTAEQMFSSLKKFSALPDSTLVYCTHEYTAANLNFAHTIEPQNQAISKRIQQVKSLREQNQPSLPSTIGLEKQTNPFMRADIDAVRQVAEDYVNQPLINASAVFSALRQWKDNY